MAPLGQQTPAFGKADLSNCEREQIHLAGSIQPHGALLVLREPDLVIVQASTNSANFLQIDGLLGKSINDIGETLAHALRAQLSEPLHVIPRALKCRVGRPGRDLNCLFHRLSTGGLVLEFERSMTPPAFSGLVSDALQSVTASSNLQVLCDETAKHFRKLTGYDRVMVYRFDSEGHGEIFSEEKQPDLEPYLGNHYPATDIPQIARRLYERNRVRVLVDVNYEPVPVTPRISPMTGQNLDMSLCFLRSMSPIHIQYLKNMGVSATLVVSLVVAGRLWGLVACHHYTPRNIDYETRTVCELLAESVSTRIAALESFDQAQAEVSVRRLEQRVANAISREGDWRNALFDASQPLLRPVDASGAALLFEGEVLTQGEVPGTRELREIGAWLDARPRQPVFATACLAREEPAFEPLIGVASGLLAVPVSSTPGEYLLWFRPERIHTVIWGGDPREAVIIGDDPSDLSPRRSFAQWRQQVEGTSIAWSQGDVTAARLIGEFLTDMFLQFRSVRMLIAQHQVEEASLQVARSELPVVVADATGRILVTNEPFQNLLPAAHAHLDRIEDLPSFFKEAEFARQRLGSLFSKARAWRGEVHLDNRVGDPTTLLVRADPVFSATGTFLGAVIIFTDLTEREAVETARRRFQKGVAENVLVRSGLREAHADPVVRTLLDSLVSNAQLAALEITESPDLARMPGMLEGVRTSVSRAAELLEHLLARNADLSDEP